MENRFDQDFSHVRVHTGSEADASARSVGALAYTAGPDVVFRAGEYAPRSVPGQRLLAHELTHVIEQRGKSVNHGTLSMAPAAGHEERTAERASRAVIAGGAVEAPHSGAVQLQRQPAGSSQPSDAPKAAPKRSRADAATALLRRLRDHYKADPNDKAVHDKYLVTILHFLQDTVTDQKMSQTFASLEGDEARTARSHCEDALNNVKRLETAFRTGFPRLDDDRVWNAATGAMEMAKRYIDMILNYRPPVPLTYGYHKVVDEQGVLLGYLYWSQGYFEVLDPNGKRTATGEIPLERPLIDPIDIVAGGLSGVVRGALRGALTSLVTRAPARAATAAILFRAGVARAAPVLVGEAAPSAFVMAEALTAESLPAIVRSASTGATRAVVQQGARVEAAAAVDVATSTTTSAATPGATTAVAGASQGSVSSAGAQAAVGTGGATVVSNVTAPQMDPRHARGFGGEQGTGFSNYRKEDGWAFIEGPSGSQGHSVVGSGFDGMAYNARLDLLDLIDNKSLARAGNVSSATAIDPAKNLAQNLDDAIARVTAMQDVPNRIRVLELLRAKRAALAAGTPGPSQVRLVVTHVGGQTTGVSAPLAARGVISR
jgi:hypothetical protein